MSPQIKPLCLPEIGKPSSPAPVIGVFAPCDPRIDQASRDRARNIVKMVAQTICGAVTLPDKTPVPVVYSPLLVDCEPQADIVAEQFKRAHVDILVCARHLGVSATDRHLRGAAVPAPYAAEHYLRQQRPKARSRLCPRPERCAEPVRTARQPERGGVA